MANTLKFGNGEWATKEGSTLAYNDENGNFKPLPFDFSRSTTATRVNKEGLIEVVGNNEPRIDFLNNSDGALKLEPQRTNVITHSSDFTLGGWASVNVTVTSNYGTSPDGNLNSTKIIFGSGTAYLTRPSGTGVGDQASSIYVKGISGQILKFGKGGNVAAGTNFTLNGEWQRLVNISTDSGTAFHITSNLGGANATEIEVYGAQLEQGSYATSYIPTQGSAATRVAENIAFTFPDNASFNSSNGFSIISKFGIGSAGSGTSTPFIYFNDDTSSTYIGFGSTSSNFRCRLNLNGAAYLNTQGNALRTQENSLFVSCDADGWSQGANGVTNDTGNNDASVFNKLSNISYLASELYGIIRIKELSVYNTRLSNAELQALTTL